MGKPTKSVYIYNLSTSHLIGWRSYFDWFSFLFILVIHALFYIGIPHVPIHSKTVVWAFVWGQLGLVGITTGYHRLWCHRSYQATLPLQYVLAVLGASTFQWSIKWWAHHHRAHHRFVDTYRDPYNVKSGLFWSHIGWIVTQYDRKNWGVADTSDIENDSVAMWQWKYYYIIAVVFGGLLPVWVAYFGWNDWKGGLLYAFLGRCIISWHMTWIVNSLAHWVGDQPYSDKHTSRQNLWIALCTFGEGYHNFHHEFPSDYRNGPQWYDIDTSKWFIALWEKLGWASHLNRTSSLLIEKCRTHLVLKKSNPGWKGELHDKRGLPLLKWDDYVERTQQGHSLVAIGGIVYDVAEFMTKHPGGEKLLQEAIGKDATAMFHGGVHSHSWNANNMLGEIRVAVILGGGEVEGKMSS